MGAHFCNAFTDILKWKQRQKTLTLVRSKHHSRIDHDTTE